MKNLKGKKFLIFLEEKYEDLELQYPKYRLLEEGAEVVIAAVKAKTVLLGHRGLPCESNLSFDQVKVNDYDGLIIPGGCEASDKLRSNPKVLEITKKFHEANKLIAFICHAGWVPISAQIIEGVKCTSWVSLKDDLFNAGAKWVDEPVVKDRNLISSRCPDDLPYFCTEIINYFKRYTETHSKIGF